MGASLSIYSHFSRFFHQKDDPLPIPSAVTAPEWPRPPQRPTSSTHSNQTEATEITYPNHLHSHPPLGCTDNDEWQINTIDEKPTQTVSGLILPPCDVGPPNTSPPAVRLFALIIGIDDYSNCPGLRGAVADAKAMRDYLEEILGVPDSHIRFLLDCQATRDAIIEGFQGLRNDSHIQKGDSILIYFAGHGGELPAPHGWGLDSTIQCLLPRDYKSTAIHPIPDRTVGALIEDIANAKGTNITVILDCCYSAGCARDENEEYIPRTVNIDPSIPKNLDNDIWGGRAGAIAHNFAHHGLRSHVLLAACSENELAYEHKGRGQFTNAVLSTLKACAVNDLTYAEVIERIRLPKQNPQCEGLNRHCVLFNARVSAVKQVRHTVRTDEGGRYVIGAGLAQGVSYGAEFTLYSDLRPRLGVLVVDGAAAIGNFETMVTIPEAHLRNALFAKLTRVGLKVPICLAQGGRTSPILKETLRRTAGNRTTDSAFRVVEDPKEAKLEVAMENDLVVFRFLDQRVKRFGLRKLPFVATLDSVPRILTAAAHYYWYLDLTNKDDHRVGTAHPEVAIDFYPLKKDYDDYGLPFYFPAAPGLCRKDPNSDNSDIIDFIVNPSTLYGIEIKNNTQHDLYLNAFLFNTSSLSIVPYYTQSSAGSPEAPLRRNGTFTIGYGSGGTPPFAYWLAENQEVDVGHLKIFFATRPVDLSDVAQASPFVDTAMAAMAHARNHRVDDTDARKAKLSLSPAEKCASRMPGDTWFAVEVPIVQRRCAVV